MLIDEIENGTASFPKSGRGDRWVDAPTYVYRRTPTILDRIRHLRALGANWDGYGAPAIDEDLLTRVCLFVQALGLNSIGTPSVVPLSSGGVQLEWKGNGRVLEFEFESPSRIHYLKWQPALRIEDEDVFGFSDLRRAQELVSWFVREDA